MHTKIFYSVLCSLIMFLFVFVSTVFAEEEHNHFNENRKNVGINIDNLDDLIVVPFRPDILAWFENWYGPVSYNKLELCAFEQDLTPLISWQPQNVPLQEIAGGEHDGYIIAYLQNLSARMPDTDVLIRFAHEMEIRPNYAFSWYTWQAERDPEAYIAAWRHIVELGRKIDPDFRWIWSPNRADKFADPFYPGEEYVDYVGITMNLREDDEYYDYYTSFQLFYESAGVREHLESYGKHIIITEVGYSNPNKAVQQKFMWSIFDYYLKDPMISGLVFFNHNADENRMYKITDDEIILSEVAKGVERLRESE